jgi:hypothetical protein
MTIPSSLLTADRDQQFADWGTPVTFRRITQTYDPQTQQIAEEIADTTITAIVGSAPFHPTPNTAAQHQTGDLHLQIKAEDLPNASPVNRIIHNDLEYNLLAITRSPASLTIHLHCRR